MPDPGGRDELRDIETIRELDGVGISELVERLSKPKSTAHDYLQTLTGAEYLVNCDGRYHVGARFLDPGGHVVVEC